MSAVLSRTGTRNDVPDPLDTLSLNRVSTIVFSPTELAPVDLNGLLRPADLFRAARKNTSMVLL